MPPPQPNPSPHPIKSWGWKLLTWLKARYLEVDLRWLGIYRLLLGTLLCADLVRRWWVARMFYTNDGILPNHFSLFRPMGQEVFSLYHAFSTMGEVHVAFAITLVVFICFTLGYKTKLAHLLSLLLITSLNARNLFVENGGTIVVNLVTAWTLFLPMGRRFSMDALLGSLRDTHEKNATELNHRARLSSQRVASLAVLGLLLQWSVIYFFNSVHKTGRGWQEGSSIHYFLWQDRIVTWLGVWVRENVPYEFTQWATWGTVWVELILGFILLIPVGQVWLRRAAFVLALTLHGGIAAFSRLGPFSYVMTSYFVMLLGERDFQLLTRWFGRKGRKRTVFYDADCGVCLLVCRVLKRLDPFEVLTFVQNDVPGELPKGVDAKLLDETVVVLSPKGHVYTEHLAIYEVVRALPLGLAFVWWMKIPGLGQLARLGYRTFAKNRMRVSAYIGLGACGVPEAAVSEPPPDTPPAAPGGLFGLWKHRRIALVGVRELLAVVALFVFVHQVLVNNSWARTKVRVKPPPWATSIVEHGRFLQGWGMFAPEPPYDDGRLVVDGRTIDGRKLDPLTGAAPDFNPHSDTGWGQDQLLCDYNNKLRFPGYRANRQHLQSYLLNQHLYSGRPEDALRAFTVWWVNDKSPKPGETKGAPRPPQQLLSYGVISDPGAEEWQSKPRRR